MIPLALRVRDSSFDPVTLEISYRLGDSGEWRSWGKEQMTFIGASADSRFDTSQRDGEIREHTLFWNGLSDIGAPANAEIHLEIVPSDGVDPGPGERKAITFTVDNNSNPVVEILDPSHGRAPPG